VPVGAVVEARVVEHLEHFIADLEAWLTERARKASTERDRFAEAVAGQRGELRKLQLRPNAPGSSTRTSLTQEARWRRQRSRRYPGPSGTPKGLRRRYRPPRDASLSDRPKRTLTPPSISTRSSGTSSTAA
jgi:predicted Rdx family selenoprotein